MQNKITLNPATPFFDDEDVIDVFTGGLGGYSGSIAVNKKDSKKIACFLNKFSTIKAVVRHYAKNNN